MAEMSLYSILFRMLFPMLEPRRISTAGSIIVATFALAGVLAMFGGLYALEWPRDLPFTKDGLKTFAIFIMCTLAVLTWSSIRLRVSPGCATLTLIGLAVTAFAGIGPLVATLLCGVGWYCSGRVAIDVLTGQRLTPTWTTSVAVGAGVFGTAVGLLAHFPINFAFIYYLMLLTALFIGRRHLTPLITEIRNWWNASCRTDGSVDWLSLMIGVVVLFLSLLALLPELMHDALAMHLFVPYYLAANHYWSFDQTTYVWAVMPMLGDWIFSFVHMLAGEVGARLINLACILVLAAQLHHVVLAGSKSGHAAKLSVLVFLTTPLTFTEATSLFIEAPWALFVVTAIILLVQQCLGSVNGRALRVIGLLLGFALATKLGTLPILIAATPFALYLLYRQGRGELIKSAGSGLLLLGLAGIVPYLTAWMLTGNPVFPFFNAISKSPFYPFQNFGPGSFNHGVDWTLAYRVMFSASDYLEASVGAGGVQWLVLLAPLILVLVAVRHRQGLLLAVIALTSIVLTFQAMSYLRYVFPATVLLGMSMGLALGALDSWGPVLRRGMTLVCAVVVAVNLLFYSSGTRAYRDVPLKAILSKEAARDYLEHRSPMRLAVQLVNHLNRDSLPVVVLASSLTAGLETDALYPNWYNHVFASRILSAATVESVAEVIHEYKAAFILLDLNWKPSSTVALVEAASHEISKIGSVSIRRLREKFFVWS